MHKGRVLARTSVNVNPLGMFKEGAVVGTR